MNENPMGREYTREEWAAARRRGITSRPDGGGPLIFAAGPYWPAEARRRATRAQREARDWALLAIAMDREWQKPLPEPTTEHP